MKTRVLALMLMLVVAPSVLFAADFAAGLKGGYFVWRPFIKDIGGPQFEQMENGTGALYGPFFAVTIPAGFSFSASLLTGKQSSQWRAGNTYEAADNRYVSGTFYAEEDRYDADFALGYRATDRIRIFAGYKFQFLDMDIVFTRRTAQFETAMRVEDEQTGAELMIHGAAAGVNYTAPISDIYFISLSFSGIMTTGEIELTSERVDYDTSGSAITGSGSGPYTNAFNLRQAGVNFEPALGIRTGGPVITLGLRYQYMRTKFADLGADDEVNRDWMDDHLYGVFVSAMLVF